VVPVEALVAGDLALGLLELGVVPAHDPLADPAARPCGVAAHALLDGTSSART
jgi:hypothetical protein